MQFRQTTILGLFDSSQKSFTIPVYQRAYAWREEEWDALLNDLKEQIQGDNNYFYGNLLLETVKKDIHYDIIDGQQRLVTLTIFMRSLIDVLTERKEKESIDIDLESKERIYLKNGGNIKLRPVEYDKACFDTIIIEGKHEFETASPSQKRIKAAKLHFAKNLKQLVTTDLIKILDKIETTEITCIELTGKKDAALMFELQNNRGRDLTNMEKLKSYFMYQMYVHSPAEETEQNIEHISNIFKHIYLLISDLNLNEDSLLFYHCQAYVKGYPYRSLEDIKYAFQDSSSKVNWIKDFVSELHTSFSNIKKFEKSNNLYVIDLRRLGIEAFLYPFIIKGYKFFGNDESKLNTLFHILEIVSFRHKLANSRADIVSRLNELLLGFDMDLQKLRNKFKGKFNDTFYWGDMRTKEYLNESNIYENKVVRYILWKYEDYLQGKGYSIIDYKIDNEQIEHIAPVTPYSSDTVASGYEVNENNVYDFNFRYYHLNKLGNLLLISGSHNSSIGNRPFIDKLKSYNERSILIQQSEIKSFITNKENIIWDAGAIDNRQKKIVDDFAVKKWDFNSVLIV
jgi:Protein of unknown function DUF262/Protein of unknown function (DUF1524)